MAGDRDEFGSVDEARAEVARLRRRLAEHEAASQLVRDELRVQIETTAHHRRATEQTLEWFADLFEYAPVPYLVLDGAGLISEVNLTGVTFLGVERTRLLGRPLRLHVLAEDRRKFLDHMLRCRHSQTQVESELRLQAAGGRILPMLLLSRRVSVSLDGGPCYRTAMYDLSERKRIEVELQLGHQRLELALAASRAGPFEYTWPHGRLTVGPRWAEIVGALPETLPPGEQLWAWLAARVEPADRGARDDAHAAFIAGETAQYGAEFRVRRRDDGAWIWVRELGHAAARGPDHRVSRVVGVLVDITAEKQRIVEAEQRTAQLRALSAALFRVEANERRELATLLHDDLGQRLVAAKLKLAAASKDCGGGVGLQQVGELLDEAHHTIRSLSFQLSPPILRDLGLVAGLRWLARELASSYGLHVEVDVDDDGPLPPLLGDPTFLLFRCVRELLLNVVKHAQVGRAMVCLSRDDTHVHIDVVDLGVGFRVPRLAAERLESRSFGLLSVQERIEGIGGKMTIDSTPGHGTRVLLAIPRALESGATAR